MEGWIYVRRVCNTNQYPTVIRFAKVQAGINMLLAHYYNALSDFGSICSVRYICFCKSAIFDVGSFLFDNRITAYHTWILHLVRCIQGI